MQLSFLKKFRRITYSTSYLPEIDGVRFLAILSVVVIMHITNFIDEKFFSHQFIPQNYWRSFVTGGGSGVPLFFMISGFILSLPFAKWRLNNEKKIKLRNYYLRRVTRLEPPYIIALVIFFIANVWVLHKYSFSELLPHFFASTAYVHTISYKSFSWILPVAWSLEVEVQFYILAPLFFLLFLVKSPIIRWSFWTIIIFCSAVYWFDDWGMPHVFKFLHYFFCGILLTDLYCYKAMIIKNEKLGLVIGIASLIGFLFIGLSQSVVGYFFKMGSMFFLIHTVLTNSHMKKIFSMPVIVAIGGMCYSIYLLHFAVVSFMGNLLIRSGISLANKIYFIPLALLFIAAVLIISAIYFVLVERPFMKPIGIKRK